MLLHINPNYGMNQIKPSNMMIVSSSLEPKAMYKIISQKFKYAPCDRLYRTQHV